MIEQLALFDLLDEKTPETVTERDWCPYCHSNWGHALKPEVLDRLAEEHAEAAAGRCQRMIQLGVTEPFYTKSETPWRSGWSVPRPRPHGFRGLDQLRHA